MAAQPGGQDDQVYVAILILFFVVTVLAILGPIGVAVALLTIIIGIIAGLGHAGGVAVALGGAGLGAVLIGPQEWLAGPALEMAKVYQIYLFDGSRWDMDGLAAYYTKMLAYWPSWKYFTPLGIFAGGAALTVWQIFGASPLRRTARGKPIRLERRSLLACWADLRLPKQPAAVDGGTLLGVDKTSGRKVHLSDADANTHSFVLGTPGSGKTVAVLNMVESAIERRLPVIVIDGKGDHALASKVITYARSHGRPAHLFAMTGDSCRYNPLAAGGYSAKKDRIIELREWSEDHYRKLAEGYLQMVFKVLAACEVQTDLVTLAGYLSTEKLLDLIRKHETKLGGSAQTLMDEVEEQVDAEKHAENVRSEIRNLARSEIGHLFMTDTVSGRGSEDSDKPAGVHSDSTAPAVLELPAAIAAGAVVYFCLPTLQFPALAKTLGKVVINDLKAAAHEQLAKPKAARVPIYAVFDEFSVFAGEQVLNIINMGRSAGIHAVLATQSVADLGRATPDTPDHFTRQIFSSCNNYLVHRMNAPEDATLVAELIGTRDGIEHTAQIDGMGATGVGSVRRAKNFLIHPDIIKQLPKGEAVFVNKNVGIVQQIKVRLGSIAR